MVKIKALLEGLSGKGISLNTRALAQFTADNGVLVTVRCGRPRGRVSLPPRLLGLQPDKWDKESQDFFSTHVAMGQLTMVPKELDARLNQLDTRARRLAQSYTVNGSYMLLSDYDEFRDAFEEIRDEYLATIARVADQWDDIRDTFEDSYVGKVRNDYDAKQMFVAAIRAYQKSLQPDVLDQSHDNTAAIDVEAQRLYIEGRGIDTSAMDDTAVAMYNTGSRVFISSNVKFVDAMEDLNLVCNM